MARAAGVARGPALCLSFQSRGRGPDAVAAGLCPPPEVLVGRAAMATVSRGAEDGRPVERRARFLPLGMMADGCWGFWPSSTRPTNRRLPSSGDAAAESRRSGPSALHEHVRRFRQEAAARYRADRLIGQGPAMRLARRQVELAAASRASVLLVGPPGSGRQHLAAAIHYGVNPTVARLLTLLSDSFCRWIALCWGPI